jgi:hypothetical protein
MEKMPGALAPWICMGNQRFIRATTMLAAEFVSARGPCSESRVQILDNLALRTDAVSAIN